MKIAEVMSSPVICIRPAEPVAHAKNLMLRHGIKRLVVVDQGRPVGIVSMRDLAERLGRGSSSWRRRPIDLIPVARVVSRKLVTASPDTGIEKAAGMMLKHGISSLLVTEGNTPLGILTKTDLTRYFAGQLGGRAKVEELMTGKVVTVDRRHSIARIVELMEGHGITRVVVVDGGRPVGIVAVSDIALAQLEDPGKGVVQRKVKFTRRAERASRPKRRYVKYIALLTAEDVMEPDLLAIGADEDAASAAGIMLKHGISGLPVVEGEKLVGILTKTDLAKKIASGA